MPITFQTSAPQPANYPPIKHEAIADLGLVTRIETIQEFLRLHGPRESTGRCVLVDPGEGSTSVGAPEGEHVPACSLIALGGTSRAAMLALLCGETAAILNFKENQAVEDARATLSETVKTLKNAAQGGSGRHGQGTPPKAWLLCDHGHATSIRDAIEAELAYENITATAIAVDTSPLLHGLLLNPRNGGRVARFFHASNLLQNKRTVSTDGVDREKNTFSIMGRKGTGMGPESMAKASDKAAPGVAQDSSITWSAQDFPALPTLGNTLQARRPAPLRQGSTQLNQVLPAKKQNGRIPPSAFQPSHTLDQAAAVLEAPKGSKPYSSSEDTDALQRLADLLPTMLNNSRRNQECVPVIFAHLLNRLKRYNAPCAGYERVIKAATGLLEAGLIHQMDGDDISIMINGMQGIGPLAVTNDLLRVLGRRVPSIHKHWTKKPIVCILQGTQHQPQSANLILDAVAAQIDYLCNERQLDLDCADVAMMAFYLRKFTPRPSTISIIANLAAQLRHAQETMSPPHINMMLALFSTHDHTLPAARALYDALAAQVERLPQGDPGRAHLITSSLGAFKQFSRGGGTTTRIPARENMEAGPSLQSAPDFLAHFLGNPDIRSQEDALLLLAERLKNASGEFTPEDLERIMFGLGRLPSSPGTIALGRQLKKTILVGEPDNRRRAYGSAIDNGTGPDSPGYVDQAGCAHHRLHRIEVVETAALL